MAWSSYPIFLPVEAVPQLRRTIRVEVRLCRRAVQAMVSRILDGWGVAGRSAYRQKDEHRPITRKLGGTVKAISIRQPWASLIAIGSKRIETRSWHTNYRGPIAIHASKTYRKSERALEQDQDFYDELRLFYDRPFNLPTGEIIAVADLVSCVQAEKIRPVADGPLILPLVPRSDGTFIAESREGAFGYFADGRFAWVLGSVRRIEPVGAKGSLGIWEFQGDL